jgi:hypothetical protein
MPRKLRISVWVLGAAVVAVGVVLITRGPRRGLETTVVGVTLAQNADPTKQVPIPNVKIMASGGSADAEASSDSSGFFRLTLQTGIWRDSEITLRFTHDDYDPLELSGQFGNRVCIARMAPRERTQRELASGPQAMLTNIRVRYATTDLTTVNIGSMTRTFEVVNTGNVPCERKLPCSPDHKWKAAVVTQSFDANEGNQFRNVRLSCIAGPCPFTRIQSNRLLHGGRTVEVSVLNWSDTATFLFEAEVTRAMPTDTIRQSYPTIFGRDMSFILPATAQGLSIEAELNGTDIVFPLGPSLGLSWAVCNTRTASDETRLYTCELKQGYRFR